MELDEIKQIWDNYYTAPELAVGEDKIIEMTQQRSQSALESLKWSLKIELGSIFIALPIFIIAGAFQPFIYLTIGMAFFTTLLLIGGFGCARYLRKLNRIELHSVNIREALSELAPTLEKTLNLYLKVNYILTPFLLVISGLVGAAFAAGEELTQMLHNTTFLVSFSVTMFIMWILCYPFYRWYYKRMYGRYIDELKECLYELPAPPLPARH